LYLASIWLESQTDTGTDIECFQIYRIQLSCIVWHVATTVDVMSLNNLKSVYLCEHLCVEMFGIDSYLVWRL
jgi:hypothetical protein